MRTLPLQLSDVLRARNTIADTVVRTPLVRSALSDRFGCDIWMKLETMQPTGAFKLRGAANALSTLTEKQRQLGVVCCSTGNHGRAVAYAAAHASVPAIVCLSKLVPKNKATAIEALGARVIRTGDSQDDAQLETQRLVNEEGVQEIPPFDDLRVITGQGTIALEILEQVPDLQTLLVPLSGGGLIAGMAIAAKAINPQIRIVGISMDRGAAMKMSLDAGRPVQTEEYASLADSLGGGIGLENRYTFQIVQTLVDEVVLLTEQQIYRGIQALFFEDRIVGEGAAAVAHAALLAQAVEISDTTGIVVTGNTIDMEQFMSIVNGQPVELDHVRLQGQPYAI